MIKPRELNELGLPNDPRLMAPAMRLINSTLGRSRAGEAAEIMKLTARDLRELGVESAAEHQKVIEMLVEYGFTDVILIGTQFAETDNSFKCFPNVVAFANYLKSNPLVDRTILIKGSNAVHLERVIDLL